LAWSADGMAGPSGYWSVDVTDEPSLAETAGRVRQALGTPSVVVANAGVAMGGPLLDCDVAAWRRVVEVNLVGSALTARCFLPDLLETGGYHLQVASMAALGPAPFLSAYCASKAGAEGFAHVLRAEVAHRGVDVGVAYLSWFDTAMIRATEGTSAFELLRAHLPWPASATHDTAPAVRALVHGIERRSAHVYAPRWVRGMQAARTLLPALVARRSRRVLAEQDGDPLATGLLGPGGEAAGRGTRSQSRSRTQEERWQHGTE
ncbi:SDR family NAD(P)-dependent oxidoreductase, partial [Streptomyces sp. NPDC097619]|uniref:SDR family NAD(P)-dependent oxidoreductase n=1 Tax=Streptomyces sp. NPDC097619 TaxID=3157228 RepID=UPI00331F0FC1